MLTVPLAPVPQQSLNIQLDGQNVALNLYMLPETGGPFLYMDIFLSGAPVKTCVRCENLMKLLVNFSYGAFLGDFVFVDTQGNSDPAPSGLGTRYQLIYLEVSDVGY